MLSSTVPTLAQSYAVPGSVYRQLPRSPEAWVVEHLCPNAGLLNIFGSPKSGKSFLALQLAEAVCNPDISHWMSFAIKTHGPVYYLQLDTPRSLWALRLDQLSLSGLDVDNIHFVDSEMAPYPFDILGSHRDIMSLGWAYLREDLARVQPVLTIIDTLREIHSGDENASDQMHNVMASLKAASHPSAVCVISHSRKENTTIPEGQRENLLDDNRGSSYISGRMDGIMRATSNTKHSYLTYQSRTIERAKLKCKRHEPGYWLVDESVLDGQIRQVISDITLSTTLAKAEALANLSGKSLEACRSLLRRRATDPLGIPPNLANLREPETNAIDPDSAGD